MDRFEERLLWVLILALTVIILNPFGKPPQIVYTLNTKYGKVEDITALQGTWNEFKLDLVDTVRKSDRTDDEKVKIINEIMSIPTQLPTEAPK